MTESQRAIDSLKLTRLAEVRREDIWQFIEDARLREEWWPRTTIDFTPGGSIRSTVALTAQAPTSGDENLVDAKSEQISEVVLSGQVDVVMTGHAFGFSWRRPDDPWATTVLLTLTTLSGSTQISIVELGFMGFPEEERRMRESFAAWERRLNLLENLARASVEAPTS